MPVTVSDRDGVDAGLIAAFLKLTPEARVKSNDNAVRAIQELQNAFTEKSSASDRSGRPD